MKKHVMINLTEDEANYLKTIATTKGLTLSGYVSLLAQTAVVYHNIKKEDKK